MILYSIWASPRNIHIRIPHLGWLCAVSAYAVCVYAVGVCYSARNAYVIYIYVHPLAPGEEGHRGPVG